MRKLSKAFAIYQIISKDPKKFLTQKTERKFSIASSRKPFSPQDKKEIRKTNQCAKIIKNGKIKTEGNLEKQSVLLRIRPTKKHSLMKSQINHKIYNVSCP